MQVSGVSPSRRHTRNEGRPEPTKSSLFIKIGIHLPGLPFITAHRQQSQFGIHRSAIRLHLVDAFPGKGSGRFMPYLHRQVRHQHQHKNLPVHQGGGRNAGRHPPPLFPRRLQQRDADRILILLPRNLAGRGAIQGNEIPFRNAAHPRILPLPCGGSARIFRYKPRPHERAAAHRHTRRKTTTPAEITRLIHS